MKPSLPVLPPWTESSKSLADPNQQFLISHAQRSYWGNTHLLNDSGKPLWVVYEGEYAMINTFDLSVDQCFYEMRRNPWVVRNLCDQFVNRYSYYDTLNRPVADAAQRAKRATMCRDPHRLHDLVPEPAERNLPGGISFSRDMRSTRTLCRQGNPAMKYLGSPATLAT